MTDGGWGPQWTAQGSSRLRSIACNSNWLTVDRMQYCEHGSSAVHQPASVGSSCAAAEPCCRPIAAEQAGAVPFHLQECRFLSAERCARLAAAIWAVARSAPVEEDHLMQLLAVGRGEVKVKHCGLGAGPDRKSQLLIKQQQ